MEKPRGGAPQSSTSGWRLLLRQPRILWLLGILLTLVITVPVVTWYWVQRDRAELLERFARERLETLRLIAQGVEEDMQDVTDDLRFVVRLVKAGARRRQLRPLLLALLGTSRTYRGLVLRFDAEQRWAYFPDPHRPLPAPGRIETMLRSTVARLDLEGAPSIVVSPTIVSGQSWYRIFATRLNDEGGRVALVVDMRPHMAKLKLAAVTPQTLILVIGPEGEIVPVTDDRVRRAMGRDRQRRTKRFRALLSHMSTGRPGTVRIPRAEASRLGMGTADVVAAYHPIRMEGGGYWAVATLTSMAAIQAHERSLLLRFGLGAGAVMLLLLGVGTFVLQATYRQAALLEQVRHAEVVAHLHDKAEKTLESIPSGVLVLGDEDLVTDVNRALRSRLGDPAIGRPLSEAFPEASADSRDRVARLVAEARHAGEPQTVVVQRLALFGEEGHYRLHAVPLQPASPQASMLLVVDDITELKALEEQLLRTEKLSTVGTLAAGIAHEIGTPLSVVRGRSEFILGKLEPDHPHAAGLRVVIDQTDRIIRTVRELLDFSRANPTLRTGVDGAAVVGKCLELLRYEAHRRQITLESALDPSLPLLAANVDQLQQVLVNLLMNAIDASPEGGTVSVRAQVAAEADAPDLPPSVRLEVQDRGAGIDPAILHRIYDPFFTTKKRGQGTGLGLFITANIVRSHHAKLDLWSAPGEGTRAVLLWPAYREGAHDRDEAN